MDLIGILGAVLFAISGIPFAYVTYKSGRTDTSISGILLIVGGSICMFIYELATSSKFPALLNYATCGISWLVVLRYSLSPRE